MDATIVLPSPPAEPRRPPLPVLAAVVPVAAGVVLWLVTGSLFALCFAALGPLMLVASYLDGMRVRRRDRRHAAEEAGGAWQRAEKELERLHALEHEQRWRREPGALECLREPPLRGHEQIDRGTSIVLGRGAIESRVRAEGGDDDRSRAFRQRARELQDAPVAVPLGGGICVRAPEPVAAAIIRALVTQMCLRFGPAQLGLLGDDVTAWSLDAFPHAGRRRARFRLRLGDGEDAADAVICIRMPGEEAPEGVTTVLECTVPGRARVRTPEGTREVAVEALSAGQARAVAAGVTRSDDEASVPDRLDLSELAHPKPGGLVAAIGRGEKGDLVVDLAEDGPHALVTGMTGTGKSELLTSWVTGIAAVHPPDRVAFVLIDFKGGTAFEPLRRLPHVVAVVTDLRAEGARRGVRSLTAELRRREALLTDAGARDIRDCPQLARLVIVVDEFAALLQEHPDLGEVFTDVAARGRALGMHLVLGTQRASGIIRDALAANCPLRMSLRVADRADSRFVIGSDAASDLPGGAETRGLALIRRPQDAEAHVARIALTSHADLQAAADRWTGRSAPPSPWLPPLPRRLELPAGRGHPGGVVLGRADEPEQQRQPWVTLPPGEGLAVIGGPGAGKSSLISLVSGQVADAVVVPQDMEGAWDAVAELATGGHGLVLCDDLDLLTARYPAEYAQLFLRGWEEIVRSPGGAVITLSRASGPVGRLIDALAHRGLLGLTSRIEHIAAGGDAASFDQRRPPGRAWLDGTEVQLCAPGASAHPQRDETGQQPNSWVPARALAGVITSAVDATRAVLAQADPRRRVRNVSEVDDQTAAEADDPLVLVGDPEQWRARWSLLQSVRSAGELVIAAECAAELRQLTGIRELPPFALLHADRAWSLLPGGAPRRVRLG